VGELWTLLGIVAVWVFVLYCMEDPKQPPPFQ